MKTIANFALTTIAIDGELGGLKRTQFSGSEDEVCVDSKLFGNSTITVEVFSTNLRDPVSAFLPPSVIQSYVQLHDGSVRLVSSYRLHLIRCLAKNGFIL